jgi:hypothetical protein
LTIITPSEPELHAVHGDCLSDGMLEAISGLCADAQAAGDEAAVNMQLDGWEDDPASLMYLLRKEGRFNRGRGLYNVLMMHGRAVAGSGTYVSDELPGFAIIGVRAYTIPSMRCQHLHSRFTLPSQEAWARSAPGISVVCMTFNHYNLPLARLIVREANGRAQVLGRANTGFHRDFALHPAPVRIRGVLQWVVYKDLMENGDATSRLRGHDASVA